MILSIKQLLKVSERGWFTHTHLLLLSVVLNNILDALSDVVHILGGDTANRDTSVLGHVDAVLLDHGVTLLWSESSEGEHTNLSGNVGPVTWNLLLLKGSSKGSSHVVHTLAHSHELIQPLLEVLWVVEDGSGDSGSVLWWGRVVASDDDLGLAHNLGSSGLISTDKVEGSSSLSVESHDLGEGLGNNHLEASLDEKSETIGIIIEGAGGEALVGSVKEWVELLLGTDIGDLLPLLLGWVDTSWVVGAGVEEDGGAWNSVLEIGEHSADIKTLGLLVEVSVLSDLDSGGGEDLVMVSPGWVADIESSWSELGQVLTDHSEGTGSREGLEGDDSWVVDEWAVEAEEDATGSLGEVSKTINWEVLLVEGVVGDNFSLNLADNWEDIWLSIVVSVGTDTEVDLLWVLVVLEADSETEDWVSWGHWNVGELVVQNRKSGDHFEVVFVELRV